MTKPNPRFLQRILPFGRLPLHRSAASLSWLVVLALAFQCPTLNHTGRLRGSVYVCLSLCIKPASSSADLTSPSPISRNPGQPA